jgi:hypothetical protein
MSERLSRQTWKPLTTPGRLLMLDPEEQIEQIKLERALDYQYVLRQRDEAREAAETYHAAWQDAAGYWKDKVARLERELSAALDALEGIERADQLPWLAAEALRMWQERRANTG